MDKARLGWYFSLSAVVVIILGNLFLLGLTIKKNSLLATIVIEQKNQIKLLNQNLQQLTTTVSTIEKQLNAQKIDRHFIYAKQLVETAYLDLLLTQDPKRALMLLNQARTQLENKPIYIEINKNLTEKIAQLEFAAKINREEIAFELDSLKNILHDLPFKIEPIETQSKLVETHPKLQNLFEKLKEIIVIRRVDQPIQPLLKPDQKIYLEQNLMVLFDEAQFALWQRNPKLYQANLQNIKKLISQYYVMNHNQTKLFIDKIAALATINIAPDLPNLNDLVMQFEPQ